MKDVVVIGGGAGGVPAAIRAAQLGADVAIVEAKDFGGLCMNRGCVPFGHMMLASNVFGAVSFGKKLGLNFGDVDRNYAELKKRQDELIGFMRMGISSTLKKNKIQLIEGRGELAGKGKVAINGETISCGNVILATGASWVKPDFPGSDMEKVINSDDLLSADELPDSALLFGRSPWLLEIAQFLHRFGKKVVLATPDKSILENESKAIRTRLNKALKTEGIEIIREAEITQVVEKNGCLSVALNFKKGSETLEVNRIIHIERAPSLKGLGLSSVGLDENSDFLEVDRGMRTTAEGISYYS